MTRDIIFGLAIFAIVLAAGCGAKPCAGAACRCDPSSCPGCCDAEGQCQSGASPTACGFNGSACAGCGTGQTCSAGACVSAASGGGTGGGGGAGGGSTGGGGVDAGFTPSPHRPFPTFPMGVGHVLSPLTLVTITASNDPNAAALDSFGDELLIGTWYTQVGADYGVGPAAASVHRTGPPITGDLTGAQVEQYVIDVVDAGGPAVNGQTLYLAYLPVPYRVSDSVACAYHKSFPDAGQTIGDGWGVVGTCTPFPGGETQLQADTRVGSHEIAEAVTDSYRGYRLGVTPPTPWTTSVWRSYEQVGSVEVGDLCEGTRILLPGSDGGLLDYQRSWSNTRAAAGEDPCVPANPGGYFNVSVPQDWYAVDAGTTALLPFTGWSTVKRGNWLVRTSIKNGTPALLGIGTDAGFWATTSALGAIVAGAGCAAREGMNDGVSGTLQVNMPAAAVSGDWAVLEIRSFEENPGTCYPYVDRDDYHFWLVGVYVP